MTSYKNSRTWPKLWEGRIQHSFFEHLFNLYNTEKQLSKKIKVWLYPPEEDQNLSFLTSDRHYFWSKKTSSLCQQCFQQSPTINDCQISHPSIRTNTIANLQLNVYPTHGKKKCVSLNYQWTPHCSFKTHIPSMLDFIPQNKTNQNKQQIIIFQQNNLFNFTEILRFR